MKQFEYTTIDVSTWDEDNAEIENLSILMNEYGEDGWELVTAVPYNSPNGDDTYTTRVWYTFKRELNE